MSVGIPSRLAWVTAVPIGTNHDQQESARILLWIVSSVHGLPDRDGVLNPLLPPQKYRYERLQELGSGSYAVVYKARNRETDEVFALKKLRFGFDEQGLPSSTLREISLLKELKHAHIVE